VDGTRRAHPDDLPAIAALARAAVAELATGRGGTVWASREARQEPVEDGIAAALAPRDDAVALVGTVDDVVVGYGLAHLETLPGGDRLAVVTDLYVDPQARGIGIGEALMAELVGFAEAADAVGIDSIALPGDRATKNFFESAGLKARAILVHRPLGRRAQGGETGA
jgi:ribosomal protein S18 acetylase RimI-like enzyme